MKKNYNRTIKLLFLPMVVSLVTTFVSQFIAGNSESELIHFTMFENIMFFVLIFLGVYLFTLIVAAPIDFYLSNKLQNKLMYFILFNIIGALLLGCINYWILKIDALNSLFLIFPLFSILSLLVELNSKK